MATQTNSADAVEKEFLDSHDLEVMTGVPRATWRFWAHSGDGPLSFKIGRRRVWRRSVVEQWLAEQEAAAAQPNNRR